MTSMGRRPGDGTELRRKAEEMTTLSPEALEVLSPDAVRQLFHELRVHQIELEMQNEELRRAQVELDAARERFFDLYDLAPVGYFTLSEQWLILEANLTAATLLGLARGELVRQPISRFIFKEDQDHFYLARKQLLEGFPTQTLEIRMLHMRGATFWAQLNVTKAQDTDGASMYRFTLSDISERKQAEEQLRKAKEVLEQRVVERTVELQTRTQQLARLTAELTMADQRERQSLGKVLHDHIQQMLVGVQFGLAGLAGRLTDPGVQGACSLVADTLKETLQATRSMAAELSLPVLQEKGLLPAVEWLGRQMLARYGLTVEVNTDGDYEALAPEYRAFVFDAVRELLFNVVKHAEVKRARVSLTGSDGTLEVTIQDDGVGFEIHRIEPVGGGGTGLGLFSIQERIGYLSGRLQVDSAPGQGSRFRLSIPFSPASVPVPEPRPESLQVTPFSPPLLRSDGGMRKIRILLADDHAIVRQSLGLLLEVQPDLVVVGAAGDGEQAVELARKLVPDVILMDITMPKMDGITATKLISRELPDIAIIGLSIHEDPAMEEAIREAGAVEYAAKGGDADRLISAIRAVAKGEREHQDLDSR